MFLSFFYSLRNSKDGFFVLCYSLHRLKLNHLYIQLYCNFKFTFDYLQKDVRKIPVKHVNKYSIKL